MESSRVEIFILKIFLFLIFVNGVDLQLNLVEFHVVPYNITSSSTSHDEPLYEYNLHQHAIYTYVQVNTQTTIMCDVINDRYVKYDWTEDFNHPITNTRWHFSENGGSVMIDKVAALDTGRYTCNYTAVSGKQVAKHHYILVYNLPDILEKVEFSYTTANCSEETARRDQISLYGMICPSQPCTRRTPSITCLQGATTVEASFFMNPDYSSIGTLPLDCYESCIGNHINNASVLEHQHLKQLIEQNWSGYITNTLHVGISYTRCLSGYSISQLMCIPCHPGSISDGATRCEPCMRNTYQSLHAQDSCISCQHNHTTENEGSRTEQECRSSQDRSTVVEDFVEGQLDHYGVTLTPFWISLIASLVVSVALLCLCCIVCCVICCKC